jgi:ribosomal protein L7/L12
LTATFNCPSCGAPLDYNGTGETMRCPYCNTSVIVPETLRPAASSAPGASRGVLPDQMLAVSRLALAGNKIEAIKMYRQMTNCSLVDAKAAVEAIQAGQPLPPLRVSPASGAQVPGSAALTSAQKDAILQLVQANQKIEAIKLYRQLTGVGLKEAKDSVEAMAGTAGLPAQSGGSIQSRILKVVIGLFFLGLASIFPIVFIPMGIDAWQANEIGGAIGAFIGAGVWAVAWGGIGLLIMFA